MHIPDIKQFFDKIFPRSKPGNSARLTVLSRDMGKFRTLIVSSIGLLVIVLLYCFSVLGCKFFPELAQGCIEPGLLFKILYGLLFTLVVLTLVIVPLIAIVFFRVTIVMPISKWIYGDENTLDARFFGWFDHYWSVCQKLVLK